MALDVGTQWDGRANGTVNGGGGFVPGGSGTDRSQQDAVHASRTDLVIGSAGNEDQLSSAADNFATDDEDNIVTIISGTGFTPGRYHVVSVTAGVATMDRNVGTADSTGGSGDLGGSMTITNTNIGDIVAGNDLHIKSDGTHTPGEAITPTTNGTSTNAINVHGYKTTHLDQPDKVDMPLLVMGANALDWANFWIINHVLATTTEADGMEGGSNTKFIRCSVFNSSGTSNRSAMELSTTASVLRSEAESTNGAAIRIGNSAHTRGNYVHDSVDGIIGTFTTMASTQHGWNIFDRISDDALSFGSGVNTVAFINTFYKCGNAILSTSGTNARIEMNNFVDNTTAINWTSGHFGSNLFDWNNFDGNTTDTANADDVGLNDTAVAPQFTDPDAAFTDLVSDAANPSVVSSAGAIFTAADVNEKITITGGTGFTVQIATIVSVAGNDATLDVDTGTGTTGGEFTMPARRDFSVGTNLKATGTPNKFLGSGTTGFTDQNAAQREEPAGGGAASILGVIGLRGGLQ